jgi:hypothetical protein
METRNDFRLNFVTNRNELMTLQIPRANPGATGAQVTDAMTAIIDSGVVQSARGEPLQRHSAERVTVETTDFNIG